MLASLRPAFRATRVQPIAAVREGATLPESAVRPVQDARVAIVTLLGFAALLYGLFGKRLGTAGVLLWMGVGALLIFFGVSMLSMRFIRPLAGMLGWPARRFGGAAGALAQDNARRNPQRTASTAAALMIGLALVTLRRRSRVGHHILFPRRREQDLAQRRLRDHGAEQLHPIPIAAANAASTVPGVEAVGNVRTGDAKAFGHSFFATAVNPAGATMFKLDWKVGSTADTGDARRRRRVHRHRLREEAPPRRRVTRADDLLERHDEDVPYPRHLQAAARRVAVRERDHLAGDLGQVQREPARTSIRSFA